MTEQAIVDGIYFNLDEKIYHAVPRLSGSGIKNLCVSAGTFWRNSWLDPSPADAGEDDSKAMALGRAYHCARLEPDKFTERYWREPAKSDVTAEQAAAGVCWTGTDIGKLLAAVGEAKTKAGESVVEQGRRLIAAGYVGVVWPVHVADIEAANEGREGIPAKYYDDLVIDMERLRGVPEIAGLLSGGAAEVSIFYTDDHGIAMKSRLDYLTAKHWVDLKTFANKNGKALEQAIADAFRFNRYHVAAAVQCDAVEAVRTGNLAIIGEASDDERKLVAELGIKPGDLECWYVFQEKGGIPNLLGKRFEFYEVPMQTVINSAGATDEQIATAEDATRRKTRIYQRALIDIDHAKRQFDLYNQIYRPGQPWAPTRPLGTIGDLDFSEFWLDGKI